MAKKIEIQSVMRLLEERAPSGTAESWDSVGLLVGDPELKTSGAVVSVDLTDEAIDLARDEGFSLVVTHHPCIFPAERGVTRLSSKHVAVRALRQGISVIACHTNFDQCALEVSHHIAREWGVRPLGRLIEPRSVECVKLVVYVPEKAFKVVRSALAEAGAGQIGNYDSCSFATLGEGTFRAKPGARPALGKIGKLEKAREYRLETIFPKGLEQTVMRALRAHHPYEEIAYDLYSVQQEPISRGLSKGLGYGFFGDFSEPKSFSEVARRVTELFQIPGFLMTEKCPSKIRRIGFVAGKGASFVSAAAHAGCDLFITGEVGYHSALDGARQNMGVMEIGHRESELFFLSVMADWLSDAGLKTLELNLPTQRIWVGDEGDRGEKAT